MKAMTLRLPEHTWARLREQAHQEHTTITALILKAVESADRVLTQDEAARLHKWFTYTQGMNLLAIDYDILEKAKYS